MVLASIAKHNHQRPVGAPIFGKYCRCGEQQPADWCWRQIDDIVEARGRPAEAAIPWGAGEYHRMVDLAKDSRHIAKNPSIARPATSKSNRSAPAGVIMRSNAAAGPEGANNDGDGSRVPRRSPSSSWLPSRCARVCRISILPPVISNLPVLRSATGSPPFAGGTADPRDTGMLFAASHVKNDRPWEMNSFMAENPGIDAASGVTWGSTRSCCGPRPTWNPVIARSETLLVVVGRGTNDPDANSNISKLSPMLSEGMGFG
jgi:hypothetical protein